jgi:hypothetical protein
MAARKPIPHDFVLDALTAVSPRTNPMFGGVAVYVGAKIVCMLRDRPKLPENNGVWLVISGTEHIEALRGELPGMRPIALLTEKIAHWQLLPMDSADFEESTLRACEMIVARDPRIGRIPAGKSRRKPAGRTGKSSPRKNPRAPKSSAAPIQAKPS